MVPSLTKVGQATCSSGIISVPHLSDVLDEGELINEWNCSESVQWHGQGVPLGGSLLRPQDLAIHKEFSGFPVGVDENVGDGWTQVLYVDKCSLPV